MKRNMYRYIIAAIVAAVCVSSCTKESNGIGEPKSEEVRILVENLQTKGALVPSVTNVFSYGDRIGVSCEETTPPIMNHIFLGIKSDGNLIFTPYDGYQYGVPKWTAGKVHTFAIYYPYSYKCVNNVISGELSELQYFTSNDGGKTAVPYIDNTGAGDYNLLYAKVTSEQPSNGMVAVKEMKRQFGVIEFQMVCDIPGLAGWSITEAYFRSYDLLRAGDYDFDLNDGTLSWARSSRFTDEYRLEGWPSAGFPHYSGVHNATRSLYMIVPPGTSVNGEYCMNVNGTKFVLHRSGSSAVINAGDFYTVTFTSADRVVE